ncbi:hypothetical protein [Lutispora sp.]|uniref:hypothetical protein n=1 Tax=Lutispora sp. TaxID=2828727 RepID=UPI003564012D
MKLKSTKLREYLMNSCPINQDVRNPKVYAHLRGVSGYDYFFFDFKDTMGYCLISYNDEYFNTGPVSEYLCISIDSLIIDEAIILYNSKYIGKRFNKVNKKILKRA